MKERLLFARVKNLLQEKYKIKEITAKEFADIYFKGARPLEIDYDAADINSYIELLTESTIVPPIEKVVFYAITDEHILKKYVLKSSNDLTNHTVNAYVFFLVLSEDSKYILNTFIDDTWCSDVYETIFYAGR